MCEGRAHLSAIIRCHTAVRLQVISEVEIMVVLVGLEV